MREFSLLLDSLEAQVQKRSKERTHDFEIQFTPRSNLVQKKITKQRWTS